MAVFMKSGDYETILKTVKFCEKVDNYISLLSLDVEQVQAFKKESELFIYVFSNEGQYKSFSEGFIGYKLQTLSASYTELIKQCKRSRNYTQAIGEELGIETPLPDFNPHAFIPGIEARLNEQGHPDFKLSTSTFQGVEIWKDCGDRKGYQKLHRCYGNHYIDKSPLPEEGSAIWKYSAIYLFKEEMVGDWSEEVEVEVVAQSKP